MNHCECCADEDGNCDGLASFDVEQIRTWLDRRHCAPGGVSKEVREAVELLISDLEDGHV